MNPDSSMLHGKPGQPRFPSRKKLPHDPRPFPSRGQPVQFVTLCARDRAGSPFLSLAGAILESARQYHVRGRWFLRLFLVMPDHVHAMLSVAPGEVLGTKVANWKHCLSRMAGVAFQRDFFEHRLRSGAEISETWDYIRQNPVRKGLVRHADEWPHWLGFHPVSGEELRH